MENFVNNTEVSFSQLIKKDGWFSRLIFFQLTVPPALFLLFWILTPSPSMTTEIFVIHAIWIASAWTICFLLCKKRTRFTITVSIVLLWILFVFKRLSPLLFAVFLLYANINLYEANESLINSRIVSIMNRLVFAVIALVLTIRWTRNLRKLKQLQP